MSLHICFPVRFPHRWWNMTSTVTTTPITTPLLLGMLIWSAVTRQRTKRYRAAFAGNSKGKQGQFNTIPCFFRMFTTKKVNKPMNILLHCLKWDVNQMIFFWTKARRGNELPYKRRHKRELLHDVTWSEGTHQFKAMNFSYNWMEIFYFFEFFVTFFFRLVTILYYLNDVDEGGQTAFVIADNSTLNETVR